MCMIHCTQMLMTTQCKIEKALGSRVTFTMATVQRQVGVTDCGAYAVAFATNLASGIVSGFRFQQDRLRPHLQQCFEQRCIHPFSMNDDF